MCMQQKDKMTHLSTWKQLLLLQHLTFLQNKTNYDQSSALPSTSELFTPMQSIKMLRFLSFYQVNVISSDLWFKLKNPTWQQNHFQRLQVKWPNYAQCLTTEKSHFTDRKYRTSFNLCCKSIQFVYVLWPMLMSMTCILWECKISQTNNVKAQLTVCWP